MPIDIKANLDLSSARRAMEDFQRDSGRVQMGGIGGGRFQGGGGAGPGQDRFAQFTQGARQADRAFGALEELKRGGFYQSISAPIESGRDWLRKREDRGDASGMRNPMAGVSGVRDSASFRNVKVERLELGHTASAQLGKAVGGGMSGRFGGGGGGGIGGGASSISGNMGDGMQRTGASTVIPGVGLIMGAIGMGLKAASTGSQMYQGLMESQAGTMGQMQYLRHTATSQATGLSDAGRSMMKGAMKGIAAGALTGGAGMIFGAGDMMDGVKGLMSGGGLTETRTRTNNSGIVLGGRSNLGSLLRNPEIAQVYAARAKAYGLGPGSQSEYTQGRFGDLDVKLGLATGIGGTGGAELLGGLNRYGGIDKGNINRLLGAGALSGSGGMRQGEFLQQMSSMAQANARAGYGNDLMGQARSIASFSSMGLLGGGERAMALQQQMSGQFQSRGSSLNSLAIAAGLRDNLGIVEAMARAEEGATAENINSVSSMLDMGKMDPQARALIEMSQFGLSATEAHRGMGEQGSFTQNMLRATDAETDAKMDAAGAVEARQFGAVRGQEYIRTNNQMDEVAEQMKEIYEAQHELVQEKLIPAISGLARVVSDLVTEVSSLSGG